MFFDKDEVADFSSLLSKFEAGAFASPFRSTVPLVSLFKDDWPIVAAILGACGLPSEATVHFEYKVKSAKGEGRSSQTDAMVLADDTAIAVEAKWTEPLYETVAARLARLPKHSETYDKARMNAHVTGQREFVDGWLELMRPYATKPLDLDNFGDTVYQTIHRAASACALSRSPKLVYLHFVPSPAKDAASTAMYRDELSRLHVLLGSPKAFAFYVAEVPLVYTALFQSLERLTKGKPETDHLVRSALLSGRLFDFGAPQVQRVGA